MPNINISSIVSAMSEAAFSKLKDSVPDAKKYVESEMKKIGQSIAYIEDEVLAGRMNLEKASLHLDIQKNASKTVLLTLEGLGIIAVERAINAALSVVKDTVNGALGFALL